VIPNDGFVDPVLPKSSLKGVFQNIIPIRMIERIVLKLSLYS